MINKSFILCQGFLHVNCGLSNTLTKQSELNFHMIKECVKAIQSPVWVFHFPNFSIYLFVYHLSQLLHTVSDTCNVKQLPLIVFNKCPPRESILQLVNSDLSQNKYQPFKYIL